MANLRRRFGVGDYAGLQAEPAYVYHDRLNLRSRQGYRYDQSPLVVEYINPEQNEIRPHTDTHAVDLRGFVGELTPNQIVTLGQGVAATAVVAGRRLVSGYRRLPRAGQRAVDTAAINGAVFAYNAIADWWNPPSNNVIGGQARERRLHAREERADDAAEQIRNRRLIREDTQMTGRIRTDHDFDTSPRNRVVTQDYFDEVELGERRLEIYRRHQIELRRIQDNTAIQIRNEEDQVDRDLYREAVDNIEDRDRYEDHVNRDDDMEQDDDDPFAHEDFEGLFDDMNRRLIPYRSSRYAGAKRRYLRNAHGTGYMNQTSKVYKLTGLGLMQTVGASPDISVVVSVHNVRAIISQSPGAAFQNEVQDIQQLQGLYDRFRVQTVTLNYIPFAPNNDANVDATTAAPTNPNTDILYRSVLIVTDMDDCLSPASLAEQVHHPAWTVKTLNKPWVYKLRVPYGRNMQDASNNASSTDTGQRMTHNDIDREGFLDLKWLGDATTSANPQLDHHNGGIKILAESVTLLTAYGRLIIAYDLKFKGRS